MKKGVFVISILIVAAGYAGGAEVTTKFAATVPVAATLVVDGETFQLSGRTSFALEATQENLAKRELSVIGFNQVIFKMPQDKITCLELLDDAAGTLGFMISPDDEQVLSIDKSLTRLTGVVYGSVGFPRVADIVKPQWSDNGDHDILPRQKAAVEVDIVLDQPLGPIDNTGIERVDFAGEVTLWTDPVLGESRGCIRDYSIDVTFPHGSLDYTRDAKFVYGKTLDVQPVRVLDRAGDSDPSGDAFDFCRAAMVRQWAKANIKFVFRPWIDVIDADLKEIEDDEETTLFNRVDEADAIEIFCVESFDPWNLWGGGLCVGSSFASARIILTDEIADFGTAPQIMAHEMGHVLSLSHPDAGYPNSDRPTMTDASSGTVMCPSFRPDWNNIDANSRFNSRKAANPLIYFSIRREADAVPDCVDSDDCGNC